MSKIYFSIFILFAIFSCKNTNEKTEKIPTLQTNLGIEDIPNKDTKYDTILTSDEIDNSKIITALEKKLYKSNFKFEIRKNIKRYSYNNCEENKIVIIDGMGIRSYYAKSIVPEKNTTIKNVFPDFYITVYEFENKNIADKNFITIEKALFSAGRHCNGKSPEKLIQHGNEIFHLSARAEMFRTYTELYGEFIKKID
jgi:hypothetical protein